MSDCPRPSAGGYAHLLSKSTQIDNNRPQNINNLKPNQTILKPNQTLFCHIGRGGSVADRLMDPSSETTNARLGIGVTETSPANSYHRMRFYVNNHLKTALDGCYPN